MALLTGDLIRLVETPKERAVAAVSSLGGVAGVAKALGVDLGNGLDGGDTADLATREAKFGKNFIEPEEPNTLFELMWNAFQDLTIIVLTVSGLISIVLGLTVEKPKEGEPNTAWIEGASIMLAVLIVTTVTAVNDYQKEKQFRALNAVKEDEKIKVIRNGVPAEVSKFSLVVGDIVRVDLGDIIPADGLVFDESDLKLDESAMTGESLLLRKSPTEAPFLLSGTKVMEGVGKMLVLCVGESSQAGIISKLIMGKSTSSGAKPPSPSGPPTEKTPLIGEKSTPSEPAHHDEDVVVSPLQGKLDQLTMLIGKLGLATALIVFFALVIRFSIETFAGPDGKPWSNDYLSDYLGFFIIGITPLISKKMTKHIVGQSFFQLIVLLTMTFYGDIILGVPSGYKTGPSIHYTMVFNTFVFLQLFNEVNARRIHDELNVFEGFFSNKLYIGISVLQAALQVVIVQFGGLPFKCKPLSSTQWLICLGIGAASLPIGLVLRLIETKDMPKGMGLLRDAEPTEGSTERGKELWSRGVMRVRTQIRVVKAFKRSMGRRQLALNN
ncbi:hypothetical protein SDRG_11645 [Saprolegnia diclina VS20]|uniref:Cation-transporting P-type ATPase N-terminal domain-containing protein n=1 Tax=Saprolegnia diclina (strain VS20) TaxID=1156394 RepID=T0PYH0_SAPDV|nr:hypothetical protein SDRG_11645 [Saprolegnia diclina VS20]EQC30589.1 hypothetical protein SDRG_11645 [Saprolegnia diclina VS20]|eukprot:XP_008615915.1 hypothetical protein SDRG_11645 [Saprolegnia diclina VS20]